MLAPETLADTMTLVETADDWGLGMHGNWLDMNAVYGGDGNAEENALVVGFAREGEDPEYQGFSENGDIVIQGDYGTLYLYENGSYSYIMSPNLAHEFLDRTYTETFSYQLTDADGSQTSGNFSVKFGGDNIDFESLPTLFGDDTDDTLNIEYDALVVGGAGDELILMGNSSYSVVYGREGVDRFGWDTENFVEGRDFIQDMSVFPGETIILSNLLSDGQTLDDFLENNITNAHGDYDGVYFTLNYNGVERDVTMHRSLIHI